MTILEITLIAIVIALGLASILLTCVLVHTDKQNRKYIKQLEEKIKEQDEVLERNFHQACRNLALKQEFEKLRKKYLGLKNSEDADIQRAKKTKITKIVYNPLKRATTVFFADDGVVIVKCSRGVRHDIYNAVAYALAEKKYGSNSRFKKAVDRLAK